MPAYQTPGVYYEHLEVRAPEALETGVPAFVGFASSKDVKANTPFAVARKEAFASACPTTPGYLADAVGGFFDNGGAHCVVVLADGDPETDAKGAIDGLAAALESLVASTDVDLVAMPDAMLFPQAITEHLQALVLAHCADCGDRFAILDALRGGIDDDVKAQRNALAAATAPQNGALYYPWLLPAAGARRLVPPCGHVAGVFSRTDARAGFFKAPANEEILGVLDLERAISDSQQAPLNDLGINCLRAFPVRGILVWGARTLTTDIDWRYISVRRLVLTLQRWIDRNMQWVTFEPSAPPLWLRIQRELTGYLTGLWENGALMGRTPAEAFSVLCDESTNPPDQRDIGRIVTEIALAPSTPGEFIVVRIVQHSEQHA